MLKKGCQMLGAALIVGIILPSWLGGLTYLILSLYGLWLLRKEGGLFQVGGVLGVLYAVLSTVNRVFCQINGVESGYSVSYVLAGIYSCSIICAAWGVSGKATGRMRYGLRALAAGYALRMPLLAFVMRLMAMNILIDSFWEQVRAVLPACFSIASLLLNAAMGICFWRVQVEKAARTPVSPVVQL